jgi:DNA-binding transcriptional LysR family regulator
LLAERRRVALNMDVEMPTVESIRRLVQRNEGVAFLPRMCVEQEVGQGLLCEVEVEELSVDRAIQLVYPARRALSHAARLSSSLYLRSRRQRLRGQKP